MSAALSDTVCPNFTKVV